MVYEWAQHKDVCYKLYIEERQSLEDIMQHMREQYNFSPSKRAFQTQFKRWDFPSKQNPAHKNASLVDRVRDLWEKNYTQQEMLSTLTEEGFHIKERELMRLRAKHRWLLRIPNGMKQWNLPEDLTEFQAGILDAAGVSLEGVHKSKPLLSESEKPQAEIEEILQRRQELQEKRKVESDEKWQSKKRRRRTKEYAGIPADPEGPPRFPSETTLDESKQLLNLDAEQYKAVRDQFEAICNDEGVIKKTLAGTDKWASVKQRLIGDNENLQAALWTAPKTDVRSKDLAVRPKDLALDVICTDVTKRIRTIGRRMTIAEAKNVLGINPEQSRQVRNAFYTTLQADQFTSKLETGPEHWQELKDEWVSKVPILQQLFIHGQADPQYEAKQKALETLCRDVMKRLRDDQNKQKKAMRTTHASSRTTAEAGAIETAAAASTLADLQPPEPIQNAYQFASHDLPDLDQIDPDLLRAAENTATINPHYPHATAVYIRPAATSQVHRNDKMWLASLTSSSVQELRRLLERKWPNAAAVRIDGIEKDENGEEVKFLIEEDEELDAYLEHTRGRKASFVVELARP